MHILFLLVIISTHIISSTYACKPIKNEITTINKHDNFQPESFLWNIDRLPEGLRKKIFFDFVYHKQHISWPEKRSEYIAQFFSYRPRHAMENYFQSRDIWIRVINGSRSSCLYFNDYISAKDTNSFHIFPIVKDALIIEHIYNTQKKIFSKKELEELDIHLQRSLHAFKLKQDLKIEYLYRQAYTFSNFWQHQSIYQWLLLPAFLWINTIKLYKFYEEIQYIDAAIVKQNHNKELLNAWLQHQFERTKDSFWISKQESIEASFKYIHENKVYFLWICKVFAPSYFTLFWLGEIFSNNLKKMHFLKDIPALFIAAFISITIAFSALIGIAGYCFYNQDTPLKSTLVMTGLYAAIVSALNIAKMIKKNKKEIILNVDNFDKENFLKKLLAQKDIVIF